MTEIVVGPMLRHVTERSATIFVETDRPARIEILGAVASTFEVAAHHYALVIIEGLTPGTTTEYTVQVDGSRCWPPAISVMPPSVIRTLGQRGPLRLLFGSCRAAAPHEEPWTRSPTEDPKGKGVDSLRAHGLRMLKQDPEEWPQLLLLLGDQVYADEPSPGTMERMRDRSPDDTTPPEMVGGFEEYTWLYQEAWQPDVERWVLSVVPSAMIFDDHDMIDDWNISESWVRKTRALPWWNDHIIGGLISYWIYQHLGNLSPEEIRAEGMLDRLQRGGDGLPYLREWAQESERLTPIEGGYRFSYARQLDRTRLVVIDCRNGRNLEPERAMIGAEEWAWVEEQARVEADHLLLGTSLPVMVPGGLHGFQEWNAALCDGRWGSLIGHGSEWLRRALDLEDWPAFEPSLRRLLTMIDDIRTGPQSPATISILSGDIHFSFVAAASFDDAPVHDLATERAASRVYQIVSSPIRNSLARRHRRVMRFAVSRVGRGIGGLMTRSIGAKRQRASWTITQGPEFANEMGLLTIQGREMHVVIERARTDNDGNHILEMVIDTAL